MVSEDVFVEPAQFGSFEIVDRDFLENPPVTSGSYKRKNKKGRWEELRLRFKIPAHFSEKMLF